MLLIILLGVFGAVDSSSYGLNTKYGKIARVDLVNAIILALSQSNTKGQLQRDFEPFVNFLDNEASSEFIEAFYSFSGIRAQPVSWFLRSCLYNSDPTTKWWKAASKLKKFLETNINQVLLEKKRSALKHICNCASVDIDKAVYNYSQLFKKQQVQPIYVHLSRAEFSGYSATTDLHSNGIEPKFEKHNSRKLLQFADPMMYRKPIYDQKDWFNQREPYNQKEMYNQKETYNQRDMYNHRESNREMVPNKTPYQATEDTIVKLFSTFSTYVKEFFYRANRSGKDLMRNAATNMQKTINDLIKIFKNEDPPNLSNYQMDNPGIRYL